MPKVGISLYGPNLPKTLVYMLQSTEYQVRPYLAWFYRTTDFSKVAKRRQLELTNRAKLIVWVVQVGILGQLLLAIGLIYLGFTSGNFWQAALGALVLWSYPVVWAHLVILPLWLAKIFVVGPKNRRAVRASHQVFRDHQAVTIAVAGSYGKTTVKELLLTILGAGKKVAATPANKNVAVSHAHFAHKLTGDEEVLIIEYGEGQPGDVKRFAETTHPDIGIITGLAPAHLDKYKTLESAAEDIFSLQDYVDHSSLYVNADSAPMAKYIKSDFVEYTELGTDGWQLTNVEVSVDGMKFIANKGQRRLKLQTKLVGRHLLGSIALSVALADKLGLTDKQIVEGVAKTEPFEHRMQPRLLAGGWLIDDTYNGNLEGIRAGLALLVELEAKRKIYVTPGLVDQGKAAEAVHIEVGELIAKAQPEQVVLMKNSVTDWIQAGLKRGGYRGEVTIEDDPLNFYTNLDQVIAVGDLIMMQNDWTDNYN